MSDNDLKYGISWVPSNANDTTGGQSENYHVNCDNDLIRRGVIKERMIACGWKHPDSTVAEFVEDDLPAVPREMSARELYSAYQRICKEYNPPKEYNPKRNVRCDECPLYHDCPRIGEALRMVMASSPRIKKWAREHPERSDDDGEQE